PIAPLRSPASPLLSAHPCSAWIVTAPVISAITSESQVSANEPGAQTNITRRVTPNLEKIAHGANSLQICKGSNRYTRGYSEWMRTAPRALGFLHTAAASLKSAKKLTTERKKNRRCATSI